MTVDTGTYHQDAEHYRELVEEMYEQHPEISLPPEYAYFVKEDLLRLLIRLARYKFVARLIRKTDRVLEVGCGSGLGAVFLAQHCEHVTGLDENPQVIEEARSINRRPNVEFRSADLFDLESTQTFDVVIALDVIEHMPIEQGRGLVTAMAQRLTPAGMAVIGSPSIYSYQYQSALSRASHVKCYDQGELVELLDESFGRTLSFSMNDEVVHTGHPKMAWYYFVIGCVRREAGAES